MERLTLGKREQRSQQKLIGSWMMPRGRLTKVDMESKVLKIYEELDKSNHPYNHKEVAKEYLRKVMDVVKEYSN